MASAVDICNLALGYLGDAATVSSIDPPEGSAQATHCARFYPIALAAMLEMHPWSFSTVRTALTQITNPSDTWAYAYAAPSDVINMLAVLPPDALDDYSAGVPLPDVQPVLAGPMLQGSGYTPQPFSPETLLDGQDIILTNQPSAVLRYTRYVSDTAKFSPLFVTALSYLLASKLAGPLIKGDAGRAEAKAQLQQFVYWYGQARDSDSSQRKIAPVHQVPWVNAR